MTEYIPLVTKDSNTKPVKTEEDYDDSTEFINEDELSSYEESGDEKYTPRKIKNDKKEKNYKKRNLICYIILAVFFIGFVYYYKDGLKGGDLKYINDHLTKLAISITASFLFFSFNIWIISFMHISMFKKIILYAIHLVTLLGFVIYDHGELFDHHGLYNIIIYCLYFVIFDGIALALYIWYRLAGKKKFMVQFAIFIIAVIIVCILRVRHYITIWGYGYNGKKIEERKGFCKVRRPIPWFDLLPRGSQNFWTGSQSCDREEIFDAYFDPNQDNKLVVSNCPKGKDVTYFIIPETRTLMYNGKIKYYKNSLLKDMGTKKFKYTKPVELKDVEAVYVNCGDQSKLVVRIAGRRVPPEKEKQPADKLNVLVVYFDAVSRRHFIRSLPKTVKTIEKISKKGITHLNQFFRYGVVGFNTLKNSNALYAGRQYNEKESGVPIWEVYKNRGYVTGATDNICEDWDTVYNNRTALSNDHELIAPFCLPEYHERNGSPWGNFKGPFSLRRRCITGQYVHNYALNYTKDFIKMYDGTNPWFFRSSYIEGHESTTEVLNTMDNDLADFFDSLSDETLKRTAIIIMSDHGLHMGFAYLFSNQGRTEHKLPMLTTLIPERFLHKYPELRNNLDENEQKLISGFDIYATFRDILDFDIKKEPKEKIGTGIDISEAKITDKIIGRRSLFNKLNEERRIFNDDKLDEFFEEKIRSPLYTKREEKIKDEQPPQNKTQEIPYTVYSSAKNATLVWGKSILREIPNNRGCEGVLIHKEHCVCN